MAMLSVLIFSLIILVFTAIGVVTTYGKAAISNPGPHGLSQILYAYTSGAANNGSAFNGGNWNLPWYNVTMSFDMLLGRFFMVIPVLAIAGNLAAQENCPGIRRDFPGNHAAVLCALDQRGADRQRAHVFSRS